MSKKLWQLGANDSVAEPGDLAAKQPKLQNDAATPVDIDASVRTSVGATGDDTHLVTEKAVRDAITAAVGTIETALSEV